MKNVELLSPAGNYESFLGAIHGGADAVYLGGEKFGARAFAGNFSKEEVCNAIVYAHLFKRKVYLTLNTLVKEKEMGELFSYLAPFYEAGLDGVIVQDLGVMAFVKKQFPEMELHISTQMTITGKYGAMYAKRLGASRIVPARELSLLEIREIKKEVAIEIETFVHGALCYCYSGQCLFSSMLGGRSGNRGRCAQPCRLPYEDGTVYPLSLKDLCTIQMIPELIDAGIDSFKIEGRMKKAEYTAGVTALYRKYIDLYYAKGKEGFKVEKDDLEQLKSLYIRSDLHNGYYKKHNGREMITLDKPSYTGSDEKLLSEIRKHYIEKSPAISITGSIYLQPQKPVQLYVNQGEYHINAVGDMVSHAENRPVQEGDIKKQIMKTGGTEFAFSTLSVEMKDTCFIPLKSLNEVRRQALASLKEAMTVTRKPAVYQEKDESSQRIEKEVGEVSKFFAEVTTYEQVEATILNNKISRVYIPADLWIESETKIRKAVHYRKKVDCAFQIFIALPHILRMRSYQKLLSYERLLEDDGVAGVLVRNEEEHEWLRTIGFKKIEVADANLYVWNKEAASLAKKEKREITLPYELHERELKELGISGREIIVYGRIPMMVSAGCVEKTLRKCHGESGLTHLTDRYKTKFPIYRNCEHCYNIIYNSLPLSLHGFLTDIKAQRPVGLRLSFTTETGLEVVDIIRNFTEINSEATEILYTKGHFKRSVE